MNAITCRSNLGSLEWQVVTIARRDGPRSLNPDGLLALISRELLGLPATRRLANDALEALRRFCVRAWYWDVIRKSDLKSLTDAGYSKADAVEILAHVAKHRGFTPSFQEGTP